MKIAKKEIIKILHCAGYLFVFGFILVNILGMMN